MASHGVQYESFSSGGREELVLHRDFETPVGDRRPEPRFIYGTNELVRRAGAGHVVRPSQNAVVLDWIGGS